MCKRQIKQFAAETWKRNPRSAERRKSDNKRSQAGANPQAKKGAEARKSKAGGSFCKEQILKARKRFAVTSEDSELSPEAIAGIQKRGSKPGRKFFRALPRQGRKKKDRQEALVGGG